MKNDLLLYIGVGVSSGSVLLGLAIALAYIQRRAPQEFRYGVFYSVFAIVGSIGYFLASIAFYFQFVKGPPWGVQIFCSLFSLSFVAGLIALALFVKKNSRVLFVLLSFYALITVWLAPVFIWNLIYLIFIGKLQPNNQPPNLPGNRS